MMTHEYNSLTDISIPTDPFLLRDITSVFQEYKPTSTNQQITFSEMLDVLFRDVTEQQRKLMQSWVPKPVSVGDGCNVDAHVR